MGWFVSNWRQIRDHFRCLNQTLEMGSLEMPSLAVHSSKVPCIARYRRWSRISKKRGGGNGSCPSPGPGGVLCVAASFFGAGSSNQEWCGKRVQRTTVAPTSCSAAQNRRGNLLL